VSQDGQLSLAVKNAPGSVDVVSYERAFGWIILKLVDPTTVRTMHRPDRHVRTAFPRRRP
jgi:hypothetical protein